MKNQERKPEFLFNLINRFIIYGFLTVVLIYTNLYSQTNAVITDSIKVDSVKTDSLQIDSLQYAADSIFYSVKKEQISLLNNARVDYQTFQMQADTIKIDLKKQQALTLGESVLKDGTQLVLGNNLYFDLETRWGMIISGASKFEKGYYYGDEIRKIDKETYDVDNGLFTTCDSRYPHFYIKAHKFRLYYNDKIVGKPIIFYVNHFPVFGLPFGTFTVKRGRKVGILVPTPGYNKVYGKYIENIAFYYPYKDYADLLIAYDYYEKTGWEVRFLTDYIKRYVFNGDFLALLQKRRTTGDNAVYEWQLRANHHHEFISGATLDAKLNFLSSKQVYEGSDDLDERLRERITSSFSYRLPLWGRNLYLNSNYTDDLKENRKDITLPKISYSLPSKPIYELFVTRESEIPDEAWWKDFSYNYSLRAAHEGDIDDPHPKLSEILYETEKDSTGDYIVQHNAGIKHSYGLRFSQKLKGWLNYSLTASGNEAWFDRDKNNKKLVRGNDYSLSSSMHFSLYGLRNFPKFYVRAVRHVITPRVNFSYAPDFSENERFYSFNGINLTNASKKRRLGFSLTNKWQLKLKKIAANEIYKINDFFKISSNFSYDMEKEGKGFSDINHDLRLNPRSIEYSVFKFSLDPNFDIKQKTYQLQFKDWNYKKWDFGFDDWDFNLNTSLDIAGNSEYIDYFPIPQNRFKSNKFFLDDTLSVEEEREIKTIQDIENLSRNKKNWSFNFNLNYKTDKDKFRNHDFSADLRSALNLKLTKNFSISYDNYVDIKDKEIISNSITITRELHCWRIVFSYTKQSNYWSYKFRFFNLELPDALKFRTSDHS